MKYRIAVLASGGGTTVEAFIEAGKRGDIDTEVGVVICNNASAQVFDRVNRLNKKFGLSIDCQLINGITHPAAAQETLVSGQQTRAEEAAILHALLNADIDAVVQMGYLKRTGRSIVKTFGWQPDYVSNYQARLLNTHPGLLPQTGGLYGIYVQRFVIDKKMPYAGQTLHIVAENYDEGPTIAEHTVTVAPDDSPETLFERVQKTEKHYLPIDVHNFISAREAYNNQFKEG